MSRHTFATARRGFEAGEVRAFLEEVARELSAGQEREQQLRKELAEAENRAANPVIEESTLTAALGQETARVLQAAHDAAADLLRRAETEIAERVAEVEARETHSKAEAERTAAEQAATLQEEREQSHRQAQRDAAGLVDTARDESEKMLEAARSECRSMVSQAQELRTRILTDLSNRRRVLHLQIEQLRAGRERLSEAIQEVRLSVDHIADDLFRAEDEARLAAEAAGRSAADAPPEVDESLELARGDVTTGAVADAALDAVRQVAEPDGAAATAAAAPGSEASDSVAAGGPVESGGSAESGGSVETGGRSQQVDDLFAKLRAGTTVEAPATDKTTPGGKTDEGDAPEAPSASAREDIGVTNGAIETESAAEDQVGPDDSGEPQPELISGAQPEGAGAGGSEGTGSEEVAVSQDDRPTELLRRDDLLGPAIAGLSRRVKRALQDDQNDILHRLRNEGGWKDTVLPDANEHMARYVEASKEMLQEAARAGAVYVGITAETNEDVIPVATELASELVGPLRRRLEEDGPNVDPNDDAALVEHVGAAFREWRGDRTERLAGDHATAAFSQAALGAMPREVAVRWIADDLGAPCADCEDNALAEDVTPGEEFPTGHLRPPAHSGCRCLLVVTTAT